MRARSCRPDHGHGKVAVRVPGVAAAVSSFAVLVEPLHDVCLGHFTGSFKITEQVVALGVVAGAPTVHGLMEAAVRLLP